MEISKRTKRALVIAVPVVALSVGGTAVAFAATGTPAPFTSAHESDHAGQDPTYQSSIRTPDKDYATDQAEQAALAKLATVTPDQAKRAAVAAVPGTATTVELSNENGNVVYTVEVTTAKGPVEAAVDAGNGKVLAREAQDPNEAAEAPDAPDTTTGQPGPTGTTGTTGTSPR